MHDGLKTHGTGSWRRNASWIAFLGFVAIAVFFLASEHRAHVLGILPFLLLAACPLLHMFGHSGHDADTSGARSRRDIDTGG